MKQPEQLVIINDWFKFLGRGGTQEVLDKAIVRFNKWKLMAREEYKKTPEEMKIAFDTAKHHEEIEFINIIDVTVCYTDED